MLQGCAGAMLVAGVAGMATVEVTGKSASDHVISAVNGQDCKMSRKMQGKEICKDEGPKEISAVATVPTKNPSVDTVTRANDVFAQRARKSNESH
jgi:hypothetical protein